MPANLVILRLQAVDLHKAMVGDMTNSLIDLLQVVFC
jgi:hypothetical protein